MSGWHHLSSYLFLGTASCFFARKGWVQEHRSDGRNEDSGGRCFHISPSTLTGSNPVCLHMVGNDLPTQWGLGGKTHEAWLLNPTEWDALRGSEKQPRTEFWSELQRSHLCQGDTEHLQSWVIPLNKIPSYLLVDKAGGHAVGIRALLPIGQGQYEAQSS